MGEYTYKVAENDEYRLKIEYDTCPHESPREWENMGTMVCWSRRYNLGDSHNYSEPREFLEDTVLEINAEHGGKYSNSATESHFEDYRVAKFKDEYVIMDGDDVYDDGFEDEEEAQDELNTLMQDFEDEEWLEELGYDDLLEIIRTEYIILPVFKYEHGNIVLNTGGFSCPWDSGQCGWIYAHKDKFRKETAYKENELFSTDTARAVEVGDHVKLDGYGDEYGIYGFGQVTKLEGSEVTVDFDYCKATNYRKDENIITTSTLNIAEVMANRAEEMLSNEVKVYSDYVDGQVFGFILEKKEHCECCDNMEYEDIDSCWGFIGTDHLEEAVEEHLPEEARHLVKELKYNY